MPDSQQIPKSGSIGFPRVEYTPRNDALLSESRAQAFEARRARWTGDDPQLTYESYASGEPCRSCGRDLLGKPALGSDGERLTLIAPTMPSSVPSMRPAAWAFGTSGIIGWSTVTCVAHSPRFRQLNATSSGNCFTSPHYPSTAAQPGS